MSDFKINSERSYWEKRHHRNGGKKTVGQSGWDAATYASEEARLIKLAVDFCAQEKVSMENVLDYGCGIGRLYPAFSGGRAYIGYDPIEVAICEARSRVLANSPFAVGHTFTSNPNDVIPGCYSLIYTCVVMQHIPDEALPFLIRTLYSQLDVGGSMIMCECVEGVSNNGYLNKRNRNEYGALLADAGFSIEATRYDKPYYLIHGRRTA